MPRSLSAGLFAAGLLAFAATVATVATPATPGQDKKEPPKAKTRIAVADPLEAAKDPDFAVQGEYEGVMSGNGQTSDNKESKVGVQVIAHGQGRFTAKVLPGGLPGAGWDGKTSSKFSVTRDDAGTTVTDGKNSVVGRIAEGRIEIKTATMTLNAKKLERQSETLGKKPPEGAVVLFGREGDEKNWKNGKLLELSDGKFLTVSQTGSIRSNEKFDGFKAHLEFRLAWMPNSTGQGRSNSGVYLQDRYECQILDSFGLSGENNECGGIYTQHKPKVNMCFPPMTWQTYDIEFTPAQFGPDGKKTKNARATIFHNGVKIHDDIEFPRECPGGKPEAATPGPFQFQDHGDPVVFRNVWVVPVK